MAEMQMSSSGGWLSKIGSIFGGGSTNIWQAVLGGLGGSAAAYLTGKDADKAIGRQGIESRKTIGYTAALDDYYNQKNKIRQRKALDTYGQFSMLSRYAPNYKAPAPLDQPTLPDPR